MSRVPPRPNSEGWPAKALELWEEATVTQQRRALAHRWKIRAAATPTAVTDPECPLCRALGEIERGYRAKEGIHCRGGKQEWER
ncbi:hypothetical protein RDMS_01695 [Deinococcus sp. RL]|uniref:hypothetical protein n=1 Tax=Deinococcus sp. RL TaxID=1489678 RepID=UPI0004D5511D|nr:hypothetical protein [Deinococcus sp. RL]KEF35495.1 hypothetical protein RDMS_01695 [Deinococcus sp. RL]